jgi:hypothetical protein
VYHNVELSQCNFEHVISFHSIPATLKTMGVVVLKGFYLKEPDWTLRSSTHYYLSEVEWRDGDIVIHARPNWVPLYCGHHAHKSFAPRIVHMSYSAGMIEFHPGYGFDPRKEKFRVEEEAGYLRLPPCRHCGPVCVPKDVLVQKFLSYEDAKKAKKGESPLARMAEIAKKTGASTVVLRLEKKLKGPSRSAKHCHGLWWMDQHLGFVLPSQCEGCREAKPLASIEFRVS